MLLWGISGGSYLSSIHPSKETREEEEPHHRSPAVFEICGTILWCWCNNAIEDWVWKYDMACAILIANTRRSTYYDKNTVRMPRQYMNTNGILLEPQWLFRSQPSDLHQFYTICLFGAWIDDDNNPRLHKNVPARVVVFRELFHLKKGEKFPTMKPQDWAQIEKA